MACEFICDGCGRRQRVRNWPGGWFKPDSWYERVDKKGKAWIACSRECIDTLNAKHEDPMPIRPI